MANSTVRRFCFTWNNYTEPDYEKCKTFIVELCKYGIVGKEVAPNTGTNHLQGFCSLKKPMRFSTIKKRLDNRIHIEKANGSDDDNEKYCSKAGDFFVSGDKDKQGARNDIQAVISAIQNGEVTTPKMVAAVYGSVYIKYHRGIEKYLSLLRPVPERNFKTELRIYWGPPGSGKSRRALEEANSLGSSVYYKPRGLWWDGYEQQDSVIIDDFYGWIKYDELLKICDRYPYKVQVKGSFQEFTSKYIFITSNTDIYSWYKFPGYETAAIERRAEIHEYIGG
ncbi:Rep [Bat associated cyclovirus 13]|uniref:Replication-associated protein n=1 Tax=Bat associated cyclovirus 13 TaxID=1987738 RepID=A0A0D3MCJ9_9CIRC|nr:Rep [Bat associated cyclovirus 13]AIF76266.1 Rep [Bat associated cyclovirus 13]